MPDVENKVIVVTGASSGLGRALALEAGKGGARVALIARRKNILERVRKQIIDSGGEALVLPLDITNPTAVALAMAEIESRWNNIAILFNVAGVVEPIKRLVNIDNDEMMQSLMVNVYGVYIATREVVKMMQRQRSGGTIINISSGAAVRPYIGWTMYGSQKAAVDHFTWTVAEEVRKTAVRIAALSPGPFESPMQEMVRNTDKSEFPLKDKFVDLHRNKQLPTAEKIAAMVLDMALNKWPEQSGRFTIIRDPELRSNFNGYSVKL